MIDSLIISRLTNVKPRIEIPGAFGRVNLKSFSYLSLQGSYLEMSRERGAWGRMPLGRLAKTVGAGRLCQPAIKRPCDLKFAFSLAMPAPLIAHCDSQLPLLLLGIPENDTPA